MYEALGFKEQQYVSKLKEITERRKLATKSDLENSQLIKDLRVDKSQPKELKPNAADKNLASIMLYGHRYSDLSNREYIDDNLSTITNPAEMQSEAELLAYRILNDFMFDMNELSFYEDILLENPEYASILSTNENPVKEFFENDIFEQADKEKFEITPEQKQKALELYSSYLQTTNNPTIEGFKQWNNKQQQINELFKSNPDFANEVYSAMGLNTIKESEITYTDEEGNPCAKMGGRSSKFTKGSKWEIVKDLKGYPSHAQGGVDIKLGKNGFSFTRDNGVIEAKHGLILPKIK